MQIPHSYILNKFYMYGFEPVYKKHDKVYNAGCPVCREGKSLGKKKRLFYYPSSQSLYCFNCNKSWNSLMWLADVTGMSRTEIQTDILSQKNSLEIQIDQKTPPNSKKSLSLPFDSINLTDPLQLSHYINNEHVAKALDYIKSRNLDKAINRPKSLFLSLTDYIHKNRLCIPFYDENKKIVFYQTRCMDDSMPKYLGKQNAEKFIFNIDKIDFNFDYIFLLEGPIDAMFIKNGVSLAGLNMTNTQKNQLSRFPLHKKIWILDNPIIDSAAQNKIQELVMKGEKVFCWKNRYKDLNEWCIQEKLTEIPVDKILESLYNN